MAEPSSTIDAAPVAAPSPYTGISRAHRRAILISVLIANFLAAMESTVATTAMPTVIASLGGLERYSWVFTAYMLASTVSMPLWGKLSDLFGRRRLMLLSLWIFLGGSALSGAAQDFDQLVLFRALQGLGAGGVAPLGMTLIGELYSASERAKMQGLFSGLWGLASLVGPLLGGVLTDQLSWRWVFFVNLPIGVVAVLMIRRNLPRVGRRRNVRIDYAGALTLTLGVTMLLLAAARVGELQGHLDVYAGGLLFGAVLALLSFVFTERSAVDALVPLGLFRYRDVRIPLLCGFLAGMAIFSGMTFVPMFMQGVTGSSATQAGLALTPLLLGWVTTSAFAGPLALRVPVRLLASTGFLLLTTGFVVLSRLDAGSARRIVYLDMVLMGCGMGMAMLVLLLMLQTIAPRNHLGVVTSLIAFFRSVGGALGVATLGAVLTATFLATLAQTPATVAPDFPAAGPHKSTTDINTVLDPVRRTALAPDRLLQLEGALAHSLHRVFVAGTLISMLAFVVSLWLPWQTLAEIEQRPEALRYG